MAIEQQQSMMEHNFQSMSDVIRNAPTPPMVKSEDTFGLLENMDFSFANNYDDNFALFSTNQTITFPQYSPSQDLLYPESTFASSSFSTMQQTSQYTAPFPSSSHTFVSDAPSGRDSVASISSKSIKINKEKCMSRNAVAARENREKKKHEMSILRNKVGLLQEEAATYKKKHAELKEQCKLAQERNQYYESILTNLPSIMDIIEHMKNVPKDDNTKRLKKKLSNINFANNNLGVCFHVKTSQEMSLKFCDYCSNGTSVPKKKTTET